MNHCIINPKCKHCDLVYSGELPIMLICHKRNCADEIESVMSVSVISECAEGEKVNGIIRAYREAKEAK